MEKEHNSPDTATTEKSLDSTIDAFLDGKQATPGVSSPESAATPETTENVPATEKTEGSDDKTGFEGVDKGFANHPAWQKREQKLKDALSELENAKQRSSAYDELLGDPVIYRRFLEKQGLSQDRVKEEMASRGFEVESKPVATERGIAEEVCRELDWNINTLNADQKAYINDLIALNEKVSKKIFDRELGNRLKPLESFVQKNETQERMRSEYDSARSQAKEEFPDLDWEKDIEPAMSRYLDELDKTDPKNTVKISPVELYEKATRQILKEKRVSQDRQAERDEKKAAARPLKPGAIVMPDKSTKKGKTVSETVDIFLADKGVI